MTSPRQTIVQRADAYEFAEAARWHKRWVDSQGSLGEAIAWITDQVVGGGMLDAALPASLVSLVAQQMVDDPKMGWPDVEMARITLKEEHGVIA